MSESNVSIERRGFLGSVAVSAAVAGLGAMAASSSVAEAADAPDGDFKKWLAGINGKYRQVYDMPEPNNGMGLIWSWVFQLTGAQGYGVSEQDLGVVVVLRHNAIPIAFTDPVWEKYKLGEQFKITDPLTKAPAVANPFYHIKSPDLPPDAALEKLLAKGVRVSVCNMAITYYSGVVAKQMGLNAEEVKKDWVAAVIPGVEIVPSGVLAVNGAQSKGCAYCFAG
jgi:intracellular sulfur oxidation DsrE/DsrF family protein